MPGRDGTGPMGAGPFTGRGAGNCVEYVTDEFAGQGVGVSYGLGRGRGAGRGLRRMYYSTGIPVWARFGYTPAAQNGQPFDEMAVLKNQEEYLEKQLKQVKQRLKDFDEQK